MLLTTLKYGQTIRIGNNIVVKVHKSKHVMEGKCRYSYEVKLCVDAPKEIAIRRPEMKKQKATDGEEENPSKNP